MSIDPALERAEQARINGRKGGRPKGKKNQRTILKDAALARFNAAVDEAIDELFRAQFAIALQTTDLQAAHQAIANMLDRAHGRPTQQVAVEIEAWRPLFALPTGTTVSVTPPTRAARALPPAPDITDVTGVTGSELEPE